ncbi:helix-turn-helix transcriptional regulator [Ruthenibacterium lactatiformans]|uniref:helix-turn-helix transcriptional regulator n=1 Tax=Ruthenibacterium lactatiformans TaxID=1550024 RepID=UPI0026664BEC|nr:helix-turn-helix transcriptional regulator [Ruthenibacterium lactatiformans]
MRNNLKKARNAAGLTHRQMAIMLGIHERYYKAVESGERLGAIWMWDRLEDLFGINQRVLRENHPGTGDSRQIRPDNQQS